MELSYDEIRRIHRIEKSTSRPVELDKDFYCELRGFISEERKAYMDSLKDFSIAKTRSFTNLKRMVEEIFAIRSRKILSRALASSRADEAPAENLTTEELAIFKAVLSELQKHNRVLDELFMDSSSRQSGKTQPDSTSVKILKDIPAFVGADMKEYGPFSKEQVVELPSKVARLLISRKFGAAQEE